MNDFLIVAIILLGLNLLFSLVALLRQANSNDRILSVQIIGTNGVALVLLLSLTQHTHEFIDSALVLALLAAVIVIAYTRKEQEHNND